MVQFNLLTNSKLLAYHCPTLFKLYLLLEERPQKQSEVTNFNVLNIEMPLKLMQPYGSFKETKLRVVK